MIMISKHVEERNSDSTCIIATLPVQEEVDEFKIEDVPKEQVWSEIQRVFRN